jgi:16S rRNA processing protein RimM
MAEAGELLIGEIVGVHGIHGNLKVRSYAESDALFAPQLPLAVQPPRGEKTVHRVKSVQAHGQGLLMAFEGVDSRGQADALRGAALYIRKSLLAEPRDGAFFWYELIGLRVLTMEDQYIGKLAAVFQTGSNDVYVVRNPGGERTEILLPAIDAVIREIDIHAGFMRVRLLEGL